MNEKLERELDKAERASDSAWRRYQNARPGSDAHRIAAAELNSANHYRLDLCKRLQAARDAERAHAPIV